jgi:hypothetical protein
VSHIDPHYKNKTEFPFFCHDRDTPYSHKHTISDGMVGCVRFFSDYGNEYLINIQEGVNECPCGPKFQWFDYAYEVCRTVNEETNEIIRTPTPKVLQVHCADYIELPPGVYRFCVMDCEYVPVVPGENDILLRLQHKTAPRATYC